MCYRRSRQHNRCAAFARHNVTLLNCDIQILTHHEQSIERNIKIAQFETLLLFVDLKCRPIFWCEDESPHTRFWIVCVVQIRAVYLCIAWKWNESCILKISKMKTKVRKGGDNLRWNAAGIVSRIVAYAKICDRHFESIRLTHHISIMYWRFGKYPVRWRPS